MEPLLSFEQYCRPFRGASCPWPKLPLPPSGSERWWRGWAANTAAAELWPQLQRQLPQLLIAPAAGARSSEAYQRLVLRGGEANATDQQQAPQLQDPAGLRLSIAEQASGAVPVLNVRNRSDFELLVRCLAHRCEPVELQPSVHAQAIAGLIHWGLLREVDRSARCQLLILHQAPYSSLPAALVPGQRDEQQWLQSSQRWRLEHELTHIACTRLLGEMRINLYDELLADAAGMLAALGHFEADLFRLGLGLSPTGELQPGGRAQAYVGRLEPKAHGQAYRAVLERAKELEQLLATGQLPHAPMPLLQQLGQQRLNQPLRGA